MTRNDLFEIAIVKNAKNASRERPSTSEMTIAAYGI